VPDRKCREHDAKIRDPGMRRARGKRP